MIIKTKFSQSPELNIMLTFKPTIEFNFLYKNKYVNQFNLKIYMMIDDKTVINDTSIIYDLTRNNFQ